MLGFVAGIMVALWYRNEGPQNPVYEWMDEDEGEIGRGSEGAKEEMREEK